MNKEIYLEGDEKTIKEIVEIVRGKIGKGINVVCIAKHISISDILNDLEDIYLDGDEMENYFGKLKRLLNGEEIINQDVLSGKQEVKNAN